MPISNGRKKWFCEKDIPGTRLGKIKHCFLIGKLVFKGKTPFQKVLIFDNPLYGRILCLDDIVQFSEIDEFIYHEMMTHSVLFSHPKPESILIIGGGDGGVLREVLKHPVKRVDLVEIDKEIIKVSKKYLSFVCQGSFSDQRLKIHNLAGQDFVKKNVKKNKEKYDLAIVDCTNFGSKEISFPLYSARFYKDVAACLGKDGIMIALGASFLDFDSFIKKIYPKVKRFFPYISVFRFCMPSYHCGEYSFLAGSKRIDLEKLDFRDMERRFKKLSRQHSFRYYSPQIHKASMALAKIWKKF